MLQSTRNGIENTRAHIHWCYSWIYSLL